MRDPIDLLPNVPNIVLDEAARLELSKNLPEGYILDEPQDLADRNTAIMERNANVRKSWYKTMLFSLLGMWSLVLGLRWAITGKWRLWEKKKEA